jgi:hypothetical protein
MSERTHMLQSAHLQSAHEILTEALWRHGPPRLEVLGLSERNARNIVGKWLKQHKPEDILRALDQAMRNGTHEPVAYVTAALRHKASNLPRGVRRNETGFCVSHDSPEFPRIMANADRHGDNNLYWACKRAERTRGEVHVANLWQRRPSQ